jgi:hypothetical protein
MKNNDEKKIQLSLKELIEQSFELAKKALNNGLLRWSFLPYSHHTLVVEPSPVHIFERSYVKERMTVKPNLLSDDLRSLFKQIEQLPSYKDSSQIGRRICVSTISSDFIIRSMIRNAINTFFCSELQDAYFSWESSLQADNISEQNLDDKAIAKKLQKIDSDFQSLAKEKVRLAKPSTADYVRGIIKQLTGDLRIWRVKMWLTELAVEGNPIEGKDFVLRSPTEKDLTITFPLGRPPRWHNQFREIIPRSILEIEIEAKDQPELSNKISRILKSLTLFHGSIDFIKHTETPEPFIQDEGLTLNSYVKNTGCVKVRSVNQESFSFHVTELPDMIPETIMRGVHHQDTGLSVGFQKYMSVVKEFQLPEDRVSNSIIGLESMYLKKNRERRRGSKLADAVSIALEQEGFDRDDVKTNVGTAYSKVRNRKLHGNPLNDEERGFANKLQGPILEYLRSSIILLIKKGKDNFYN